MNLQQHKEAWREFNNSGHHIEGYLAQLECYYSLELDMESGLSYYKWNNNGDQKEFYNQEGLGKAIEQAFKIRNEQLICKVESNTNGTKIPKKG